MQALILALVELLKNLPELLKLIQAIQQKAAEAATDAKVKQDLQAISRAFKEKDAKLLNDIFSK